MLPILVAAIVCTGDLGIVSVHPNKPAVDAQNVAHFTVGVTVRNSGRSQAKNSLDTVYFVQNGERVDAKGLETLAAGASQTLVFSFERNADTQERSTALRFSIHTVSGPADCNPANDEASIRV